jgi:glycosyltransferase involved in cell wall biosynthesis
VADYTRCLSEALRSAGVAVTEFFGRDWSFRSLRRVTDLAERASCDLMHIQYPAIGFGTSLAPHLAGYISRMATIVTIHEYRFAHPLRKLSMAAFAGGAAHLVFTSPDERAAFNRIFPWTRRRSSVLPIGSNIPFLALPRQNSRIVIYFGHIKPGRGLDDFLELARIAASEGRDYRFRVVGTPGPGRDGYCGDLRSGSAGLPVEWLLALGPEEVAAALGGAAAAYLPYPDGASPRRGSLWAALGNGVPTITTRGPLCPPELQDVVCFAESPRVALHALDAILADAQLEAKLRRSGRAYMRGRSWESIASRHLDLYRSYVRPRLASAASQRQRRDPDPSPWSRHAALDAVSPLRRH